MHAAKVSRATRTAIVVAVELRLPTDDVIVLQNSKRLTLRLLPCAVVACVAPTELDHARSELDRRHC